MATIACRSCKREISERAMTCPHCGCFVVGESSAAPDATMRHIMPGSDLSGWAIAAGYLGLISLVMIPAPFAFLAGIVAIRDIKRHEKKRGLGRAWFGIVMGTLGTVGLVFASIAFLNEK
jgi:hypothetical protein